MLTVGQQVRCNPLFWRDSVVADYATRARFVGRIYGGPTDTTYIKIVDEKGSAMATHYAYKFLPKYVTAVSVVRAALIKVKPPEKQHDF